LARAYAKECLPHAPTDVPDMTSAFEALFAADYARALSATIELPDGPWRDYGLGVSLAGLGRTSEGVLAFDTALGKLATKEQGHPLRALAMYGKARALREAARCEEATRAYVEYAAFVRKDAPKDADMAIRYSHECPGPEWPKATGKR
jgi:hypothetical protein